MKAEIEWIPEDQRKPILGLPVLIATNFGTSGCGMLNERGQWVYTLSFGFKGEGDVSYWAHLPRHPESL